MFTHLVIVVLSLIGSNNESVLKQTDKKVVYQLFRRYTNYIEYGILRSCGIIFPL